MLYETENVCLRVCHSSLQRKQLEFYFGRAVLERNVVTGLSIYFRLRQLVLHILPQPALCQCQSGPHLLVLPQLMYPKIHLLVLVETSRKHLHKVSHNIPFCACIHKNMREGAGRGEDKSSRVHNLFLENILKHTSAEDHQKPLLCPICALLLFH